MFNRNLFTFQVKFRSIFQFCSPISSRHFERSWCYLGRCVLRLLFERAIRIRTTKSNAGLSDRLCRPADCVRLDLLESSKSKSDRGDRRLWSVWFRATGLGLSAGWLSTVLRRRSVQRSDHFPDWHNVHREQRQELGLRFVQGGCRFG